jgi:hypothetical protein
MESWVAEGRCLVELYLILFSFLSQGVLVASTLLNLISQLVPQQGGSLAAGVLVAGAVVVVLLADRLELIFLSGLRLARAAERNGWRGLSWLLQGALRLLVSSSYVPVEPGDAAGWSQALHRAFLVVYSSDAHYPRATPPGAPSRSRA